MAATTTGPVKARSQVNSRFEITCDGMYFLESEASPSEVLGANSGHGGTRVRGPRPNSRVNRPPR
jgi:hypothetical protein